MLVAGPLGVQAVRGLVPIGLVEDEAGGILGILADLEGEAAVFPTRVVGMRSISAANAST
jgi:hypothetical protein